MGSVRECYSLIVSQGEKHNAKNVERRFINKGIIRGMTYSNKKLSFNTIASPGCIPCYIVYICI